MKQIKLALPCLFCFATFALTYLILENITHLPFPNLFFIGLNYGSGLLLISLIIVFAFPFSGLFFGTRIFEVSLTPTYLAVIICSFSLIGSFYIQEIVDPFHLMIDAIRPFSIFFILLTSGGFYGLIDLNFHSCPSCKGAMKRTFFCYIRFNQSKELYDFIKNAKRIDIENKIFLETLARMTKTLGQKKKEKYDTILYYEIRHCFLCKKEFLYFKGFVNGKNDPLLSHRLLLPDIKIMKRK